MRSYVYYVSGHGYGHARRSAEIIRALLQRDHDVTVHVRTSAPSFIFDTIGEPRAVYQESDIDTGVVERDPLNLDIPATLARFRALLDRGPSLVDAEAESLKRVNAELILADVPFLAGDVSAKVGVPCIAVSNFTWDYILEPWVASDADRWLLEKIGAAYSKMTGLVRLPFGHENSRFSRIVDVPLVANRSRRSREDILGGLGLGDDPRPRVLIGMRGGVSAEALHGAASNARELLFINPFNRTDANLPDNVLSVNCAGAGFHFADLTSVSDVVISKLGYGIVADCIAARARLLWPRRHDFREDATTEAQSRRYIAHRELPKNDFYSGNWKPHLDALLAQSIPSEKARLDGPEVAAKVISEWR